MYYFEYLCELYFQKIKKESKQNLEEELIGGTSLDYLDESLLFLDDEINGTNSMGNKQNYLNKLGKLFSIAYVKKYIVNYVELNFNSLYKIFIWEDINSILYKKGNKIRRMVKFFILKQYCKNFLNEKAFKEFNFNNQKIPFSTKFNGFKLEINKHQFEYNVLPLSYMQEYKQFSQDLFLNNFNKNKFNDFISDRNNMNMTEYLVLLHRIITANLETSDRQIVEQIEQVFFILIENSVKIDNSTILFKVLVYFIQNGFELFIKSLKSEKSTKEKEFNELTEGKTVLVDFFATWCGPCKMLTPVLEEIDRDNLLGMDILKVDVDEVIDVAQKFGIQSIPTLIVFKDGKAVDVMLGYMPKNVLVERVNKSIA